LLAILQLLFSLDTLAQTGRDEKTLWQPYCILQRTASASAERHIKFSGVFELRTGINNRCLAVVA